MQCPRIGSSLAIHIMEKDRIPFTAAEADIEFGEMGFTAFEIVA